MVKRFLFEEPSLDFQEDTTLLSTTFLKVVNTKVGLGCAEN
jgi:hypothetical protein